MMSPRSDMILGMGSPRSFMGSPTSQAPAEDAESDTVPFQASRSIHICVFCVGTVSGFLFGLLGVGGPPYIVMSVLLSEEAYPVHISRMVFVFGQMLEVPVRIVLVNKYLQWRKRWLLYIIVAITSIIGLKLGDLVIRKNLASKALFNVLMCTCVVVGSIVTLGLFDGKLEAIFLLANLIFCFKFERLLCIHKSSCFAKEEAECNGSDSAPPLS